MNEIINALENINNRTDQTEDRISELKDKNFEVTHSEENKGKKEENCKGNLCYLLDIIKRRNIRIIRVPEGEEREKGAKSLFKKIIAENFSNPWRNLDLQVHEANRSPHYFN